MTPRLAPLMLLSALLVLAAPVLAARAVPAADYADLTAATWRDYVQQGPWSQPVWLQAQSNLGELGSARPFFAAAKELQGTLLAKGLHCAVYGAGEVPATLADQIVSEFDRAIYPGVLKFLGEDSWNGRVVTILLVPKGGDRLSGFVSPMDGYPRSVYRFSNEDALVTVQLANKVVPQAIWHLLAAQFAHLVTLAVDPDEQLWVHAGIGAYAGFVTGYGHPSSLDAYMRKPGGISLVDWPAAPSDAHVGASYLFMHYLVDRQPATAEPGAGLLARLAAEPTDGPAGVQAVMAVPNFAQLFRDWCAANAANGTSAQEGRFGYRHVQGTVAATPAGSLLAVAAPVAGALPRWSAAYHGFEQNGNWSPDFPTIHDTISFVYDKPGKLLWGINNWQLPPKGYWPAGSTETTLDGKRLVATALKAGSVEGLFQADLGPFKHVARVDRLDVAVCFDDGTKVAPANIPISHDQNLTLPAVEITFKGKGSWFSGDKKFTLDLASRSDDGDCAVEPLPLDGSGYQGVLSEFGIYYTRMVVVAANVSAGQAPGTALEYTFGARLTTAKKDFERLLHLQVKLYGTACNLYRTILQGQATPDQKRKYLLLSRQYAAVAEEALALLAKDLDFKIFKGFETIERVAYGLPKNKLQALRAIVDKSVILVRDAIRNENAAGVTPSVELDLLLFKLSNLRAHIYDAGQPELDPSWTHDPDQPSGEDPGNPNTDPGGVPATDADFIAAVQETVDYLSDLPIDMVLARDVLEKILGAFIIAADDDVAKLLKALGININIDVTTIPLNFILQYVKLKSYKMDSQRAMLAQWGQGMSDEDRESLKRLYLSQQAVQSGVKSSLCMADDASEGLYDVIDLVMGAVKASDHVMSALEHVPIVGKWAKKIKVKIIQRIVYGLNNAVQVVAQALNEPLRSRVIAVCNALTTIYVKWKDVQIDEGFGGVNAAMFAKVGVKVVGKSALLLPPGIGYVGMTQKYADEGATAAMNHDFYGTFDEAMKRVVDDLNPETEDAVLEKLVKTTGRKMQLSKQERQIANFAGCVSQVAQYMHLLDPTAITRVVAIVAGAFAGGLQLHSVFNSVVYFYQIPAQVRLAERLAFNPAAPAESQKLLLADVPWVALDATRSPAARTAAEALRAADAYGASLDQLRARADKGQVAELVNGLDGFEDASYGLRKGLKFMTCMDFRDRSPEENFVAQALMKENLASADMFSKTLEFSFKPDDARRKADLLAQIDRIKKDVAQVRGGMAGAAQRSRARQIARLDHMAVSALQPAETLEVRVSLLDVGPVAADKVSVTLVVPSNWQLTSPATVTVDRIQGHGEAEVSWTLKRLSKSKLPQCLTFQADSDNGGSTCGVVYLTCERDE